MNEAPVRVKLYTPMPAEQASLWIRILAPMRAAGWTVSFGTRADAPPADELADTDLVVIQREYVGIFSNWRAIVRAAKTREIPVIYDIDDLLIEIPEDHISHCYYRQFRQPILDAMAEVDAVTVSTPELANQLSFANRPTRILLNGLDDSVWKGPSLKSSGGRLTIGYAATSTHRADLDMLGECLERASRQYAETVQFAFYGITPPPNVRGRPNVSWHPANLNGYPEYADFMTRQTVDIAIVPLKATTFNECKSAIKYLEYGWLGVPTVYSKLAPYESVVDHGVTGLMASSPQEWYEALSRLIEDENLRSSISISAKSDIQRNYLVSTQAPFTMAALSKFVGVGI